MRVPLSSGNGGRKAVLNLAETADLKLSTSGGDRHVQTAAQRKEQVESQRQQCHTNHAAHDHGPAHWTSDSPAFPTPVRFLLLPQFLDRACSHGNGATDGRHRKPSSQRKLALSSTPLQRSGLKALRHERHERAPTPTRLGNELLPQQVVAQKRGIALVPAREGVDLLREELSFAFRSRRLRMLQTSSKAVDIAWMSCGPNTLSLRNGPMVMDLPNRRG